MLPQNRVCRVCRVEKPLEMFVKNKNSTYGREHECTKCATDRKLNWEYGKGINSHRNAYLKIRFGLTLEEYNKILMSQNGLCKICNNPEKYKDKRYGKTKNLAVDHCHKTGKIRGLLCGRCNKALGQFREDIGIMKQAIKYLKKHLPKA